MQCNCVYEWWKKHHQWLEWWKNSGLPSAVWKIAICNQWCPHSWSHCYCLHFRLPEVNHYCWVFQWFNRIISGGNEGEVRVWKIGKQTQVMEASMKEHRGRVWAIQVNLPFNLLKEKHIRFEKAICKLSVQVQTAHALFGNWSISPESFACLNPHYSSKCSTTPMKANSLPLVQIEK